MRPIAVVVAVVLAVLIGAGAASARVPAEVRTAAVRPTVLPGIGEVVGPRSFESPVALQIPVTLDQPSTATVTVPWTTLYVPGAPDTPIPQAPESHYGSTSGVAVFAPGSTSTTVTVEVTAGAEFSAEYLTVSFTDPTDANMGGYWGLGFGIITRPGADPTPVVGFTSPISGQTDGPFPTTATATIELSHPTSHPVTVDWSTADLGVFGSIVIFVPATDFAAASGTVTFAPGQTTATVSTQAFSNAVHVASGLPYVGFELSNPTGATITPPSYEPTKPTQTIFVLSSSYIPPT